MKSANFHSVIVFKVLLYFKNYCTSSVIVLQVLFKNDCTSIVI